MIIIYRIIINIILIFSPLIIFIRILKKKENILRFKEKFCFFSKRKIGKKLIWLHGASVGEIMSVIPLIEKLEKNKNIDQILITSSTLSSSKIFQKFKFRKTVHQFYPIDSTFFTKKFISHWKPSLAIFIESEIWPNMINTLKDQKISSILLNARMTKKSFRKWKKLGNFSKNLFTSFNIIFPQNKDTLKYLKSLGVKKFKFLGNLKFSENKYDIKIKTKKNLKTFLKDKAHWCASSTHRGEELICINAHLKLKKRYNNLVTIIIPRHIQRITKIIKILDYFKLKFHCHSWGKKIPQNTQIYLVDTYGDTKSIFKVSNTVFLGGSIIDHGGQNPLEASRYGCKIIHGKNINNFREIYKLLNKNNFSYKINNSNQLAKKIDILIKNRSNSNLLTKKLKLMGNEVLKLVVMEINYFLRKK